MLNFISNNDSMYHINQIFFNTIEIVWFENTLSFQALELIKLKNQPSYQPYENLDFADDLICQVYIFISFEVSLDIIYASL